MAEYLGYVNPAEVKANPTLDWSSVINDVRDTLVSQEKEREATRQKASKETNDLYNELGKVSTGQSQSANEFITSASYQAKDLLNNAYKMYTSGKIKGNEYNTIKSNMSAMFSDINTSVKGLQDDYNKYVELSQKGDLSLISDYNQQQKGKAFDLSNKKLYIDPTSGKGYLATVIDDKGNVDKENLIDPAWLKTNQSYFTPKVDVPKEVSRFTKDLGKFQEVLRTPPAGGIWTIEDASRRPGFGKWLDDSANAIASDPTRMASILGDYTGQYTLTGNASEAGKDKILMQRDLRTGMNTPVLTPAQEKEAKDAVKNAILQQVNSTLKQEEGTYRPPVRGGGGGNDKPEDPNKTTFIGEPSFINKGDKTIGKVVPVSGVNIKRAPGVVEQVNRVGVSNGKLFMTFTSYNGSGNSIGEDGMPLTYKKKKTYTIYEDKDRNNINERLRFVGGEFSNVDSAKSSLGIVESKSRGAIDEGKIQYLLKQNPGATRKQIIEALKNK